MKDTTNFSEPIFGALLMLIFWAIIISLSPENSGAKAPVDLHRNRFFDNCGAPNVIEPKKEVNRGKINHIKWS